jgi:hydrogenase maturation protein HypF
MFMTAPRPERLKVCVRGAVQGVGFRPFVYRLATELGLAGWVNNSPEGVFLEVEGRRADAETFLFRLEAEKPPRSFIQSLEASWLPPARHLGFEIRKSRANGQKTAVVLPDIATCPECLREIFDPANRRYLYPFTNCTHCGPRFSIIESLPYDRANTSMKAFAMCPQCEAEYQNPRDRRFHAQPNACPRCGPNLEFWNAAGEALFCGAEALLAAVFALRSGKIVAVKGLGGFHLMAAAQNDSAIRALRERKQREEKPFALMFPSLVMAKRFCEISSLEKRLLRSPEAPIVLLDRLRSPALSPLIAPNNPCLGVMLPCTPLHHLLMAQLQFPVVATSGNASDEPICTDETEAVKRLYGIADVFLVHNRPIVRHVDDSVVRVMLGRETVLRRARGYAPLPVQINATRSKVKSVLAVGAHMKNSVALSVRRQVFISQHIGDLETERAFSAFEKVTKDFRKLYATEPDVIACDLHPDYLSTQFAAESAGKKNGHAIMLLPVQHHIAHVLSCMAENEISPPLLGISWDGTGYGTDGTVWGGEFFHVTESSVERVAHLRQFRLPGGDKAVKEPRRAAMGLLCEIFGEAAFEMGDLKPRNAFSPVELAGLKTMLAHQINSPRTTSAGRLFDAVAALIGLRQKTRFEGQAAMELEFAIGDVRTDQSYPLLTTLDRSNAANPSRIILNWQPTVEAILSDIRGDVATNLIAAKFHNALVEGAVAVAKQIGAGRVALSGGCFQNRYLTERTVTRLRAAGFQSFWHRRVPPNDGGIALGQVMAALWPNGKAPVVHKSI